MDLNPIMNRLGKAKRRSTLSIAGAVVGVATAGVALGYGITRLLRGRNPQQEPEPQTPDISPVQPESATQERSANGGVR